LSVQSSSRARGSRAEVPVLLALVAWLGTLEGALDVADVGGEEVFARAPWLLGYAAVSWLLPALFALAAAWFVQRAWRAWRAGRAPRVASLGLASLVLLTLLADGRWDAPRTWLALAAGLVAAWAWERWTPRTLARLPRAAPWLALTAALLTPLALGALWHPGAPSAAAARATGRRPAGPNVLLIVADALRADALGAYRDLHGAPSPTPRLDALAAEGWRVPDTLAASSWTLPSVATLLSGASPRVHGVRDVDGVLPADLDTLLQRAREAGYATGAVLGNPILDRTRGVLHDVHHVRGDTHRPEASFFWVVRLNRWAVRLGWITGPHAGSKLVIPILDRHGLRARRSGVMMADELVDAGLELLDGFGDAPFFLYLHAFDPHDPYLPHPAGVLRHEPAFTPPNTAALRALYAGEVAFLDAQIGRLLDTLAARGLLDDTLVVFTADHGEEFREHGRFLHRGSLHDELVRLPLLVRFPASVPHGAAPARASLADVAPTLLGALGLPPLERAQGVDLRAQPGAELRVAERIQSGLWLTALRTSREHWIFDRPGLPLGDPPALHELLPAQLDADAPLGSLRLRVYDLADDPAQLHDVAAARRAAWPAMLDALRAYFATETAASRAELSDEARQTLRSLGYVK